MKNLKNKIKNVKGITLISLVITIIVLIILAGVTLNMLLGENGIINRTKTAKDENDKATATETMNLKITNVQISKYAEEQRMPTLKELADNFCEDDDFQYVQETSEVASLTKITNNNPTSIYTKLKAYPYEFEINSSLQLASIDGIKVATVPVNDDDTIVSMTKADLKKMIQDEIAAANPSTNTNASNNYSTDEQVVGTWIDNKTIYQKTFTTTTTIPSSSSWVNITIPDSNIETLIDIELSAHSGDIMLTTAKADVIMLNGTTVQIQQRQSSGLTFTIDGITLRYTKKNKCNSK